MALDSSALALEAELRQVVDRMKQKGIIRDLETKWNFNKKERDQ